MKFLLGSGFGLDKSNFLYHSIEHSEVDHVTEEFDQAAYLEELENSGEALCEQCLRYALEQADIEAMSVAEQTEMLREIIAFQASSGFVVPESKMAEFKLEAFLSLTPEEAASLLLTHEAGVYSSTRQINRDTPFSQEAFAHILGGRVMMTERDSGERRYFAVGPDGVAELIYTTNRNNRRNELGTPMEINATDITFQIMDYQDLPAGVLGLGNAARDAYRENQEVIEQQRQFEEIFAQPIDKQLGYLEELTSYLATDTPLPPDSMLTQILTENPRDRAIRALIEQYPEQALFLFVASNPEAAENLFTTESESEEGLRQVRFFGDGALNSQLAFQHFLADRPENNYIVTTDNGVDSYWGRTLTGYQFLGDSPSGSSGRQIGDIARVRDGDTFRTMSELPISIDSDSPAQTIINEFVGNASRSDLEANRQTNFLAVQTLKNQASDEFTRLAEFAIENEFYSAEESDRSGPYYEALCAFQINVRNFRAYLDGNPRPEGFQIGAVHFDAPIDYNLSTAAFDIQARQAYEFARAQLETDLAAIVTQDPAQIERVELLRGALFAAEQQIRGGQIENFQVLRQERELALRNMGFDVSQLREGADHRLLLGNNAENLEMVTALQDWSSLNLTIEGMELQQGRSLVYFEIVTAWDERPLEFRPWADPDELINYYQSNPEDIIFADSEHLAFVMDLMEVEGRLSDLDSALVVHGKQAAESTELYQALGESRESFVAEVQRRANAIRSHNSISGSDVTERGSSKPMSVSLAEVAASQEGLVGLIDGDIEHTDTGYRFRVKGSEEDAWIEANLQTGEMTPAKFLDSPYKQAFSANIDSSNLPYMQVLTTIGEETTFFPQATTEQDLTGLGGWELEKLFRNLYPIGRAELDGNTIAGWRRALELYDGFPGLLAAVQSQGQSEQAGLPDLLDARGNLHSENTRFYAIYFERILTGSRVTSAA